MKEDNPTLQVEAFISQCNGCNRKYKHDCLKPLPDFMIVDCDCGNNFDGREHVVEIRHSLKGVKQFLRDYAEYSAAEDDREILHEIIEHLDNEYGENLNEKEDFRSDT